MFRTITAILILISSAGRTFSDIRVPPSIIEEAESHMIYRPGAVITLPCVATGKPQPQYEWFRDGQPLALTNWMRMSPVDGTLTIDSTAMEDQGVYSSLQGYYQCHAHNDHGVALSLVTFLEKAFLSQYPSTDVVEYHGSAGDSLTVPCAQTRSVPFPTKSWKLALSTNDNMPMPLTLDRRITIDHQGNLYFAHLQPEDVRDGRLYKCNAFNPYVDLTTGGSYSTIIVDPDTGENRAPENMFATESPLVALVGQKEAKLKCFFSGRPTPNVLWESANGLLPPGRHQKRLYDTELVLKDIRYEDEGEYICKGRNDVGISSEVRIFLDVQESPSFVPGRSPMNFNATEGTEYTYYCDATAEPNAGVQWLINGVPLDHDNPGPRRDITEGGKALTIRNLCKDCPGGGSDLMVVQCNASNVHGYAFTSGYLNVLAATTILKRPVDIHITGEPGTVEFPCEGTSDPSTPFSVAWQRNDEMLYPEIDPRMMVDPVSNTLYLNLKNLTLLQIHEEYGGEYSCIFDNGYSTDKASAFLTVADAPTPAPIVQAGIGEYWWVFLIVALVLLLLILLLCCCVCAQRNKGQAYPVDEKERLTGNDPEKELEDNGFQDYIRPVDDTPVKGSRQSLGSRDYMPVDDNYDDDTASLDEYADIDPSRFNEDGSFIGTYKEERRRSRAGKY